MRCFVAVVALGAAVLLGGPAASANPLKANAVTERSTDFSSQHHQRRGHGAQRAVRSQHGHGHRSQRRGHGGGHGGGHR